MIKIKTFGEPLQPFKAQRELEELDGPGTPAPVSIFNTKLDDQISHCRRFWPDQTGTQGFFVAKVVKQ